MDEVLDEVQTLDEADQALDGAKEALKKGKPDVVLMLILDVKTRWSSTHQMLRKFLLTDINFNPCY